MCAPSNGGTAEVCTVSDTDGIHFVQVGNTATNEQQQALTFDCANAPKTARFRVPANTKYNVTVADCAAPRNTTSFVLTEDARVRQRTS